MGRRHHSTDPLGFTFLEMLLVIALVAIVAGIGYPLLVGQVYKQSVTTATLGVAMNLEEARSRGLMGMTGAGATFTANANSYEAASGVFVLEDGYLAQNATTVAFSGFGTTSSKMAITIKNVNGGQQGNIMVATQGCITWTTTP